MAIDGQLDGACSLSADNAVRIQAKDTVPAVDKEDVDKLEPQ
eukprot:SAG31_NODE_16640_length_701_cov_1.911960_1_plen_41_part_10